MEKSDIKNLKKRYLLWFYKVSKEALDRIDRKFTQVEIDRVIIKELKKTAKDKRLYRYVEDFDAYIKNKEKDGLLLKYDGMHLKPEYTFLALKVKAIEKTIRREFGRRGLEEIKASYEQQMRQRILEEREHKR